MKISFKTIACLCVVATIYLVSVLSGREPPKITATLVNVFWFGLKSVAIALAFAVGLFVFFKVLDIARRLMKKLPSEIKVWLESSDAELQFFFIVNPFLLVLAGIIWWAILHQGKYHISPAAVFGIWVASFLLAACGGKSKIWHPLPKKMAIAISVAATSGYTSMGFLILSLLLLNG